MGAELKPSRGARFARAAIVAGVSRMGVLRQPVAAVAGAAWYASRPAAERRRAARNHRRLNPHLTADAARRLARRSFFEYVRMITEAVWAEALSADAILQRVHVRGEEHVTASRRAGVLVLCHHGNWDIAASAALALGVRMTTVMAPIISPGFTAMVAVSRRRKGLELYTPRQAARGLVRALRQGRFVALMADIPEAGPTVVVPYCGGPVAFSAVPARLALHLGVPLLPVSCWRAGSRWTLEIHPPLASGEGAGEAALTAELAAVLERAVRNHPEQWYPFHEVYARA